MADPFDAKRAGMGDGIAFPKPPPTPAFWGAGFREKTADSVADVGVWVGVSSGARWRPSHHESGEGVWPSTTSL